MKADNAIGQHARADLPEGWAPACVDECFDSWGGATPSTSEPAYWGGSVPWISSKDVKQSRITAGTEYVTSRALAETRLRPCPRGSVLVVIRSGVLVHTLPVTIADAEVVINQDLKAFVSPEPALNEWLAVSLRAMAPDILLANRKDGTTVQSIRYEQLKKLDLPVPALAEQKRIVAKVEELLGRVSAARARLAKVPALLKRFRQSVLAAACSGGLTAEWRGDRATEAVDPIQPIEAGEELRELPIGWYWRALGSMGEDPDNPIQTGPFGAQLHNDEFVESGVPVVAVGNLTGMGFTKEGLYYITPEKAAQLARYTVNAGDVLFARSGATLGKVCVAPSEAKDWRMTGHILRVRLDKRRLIPAVAVYALHGDPDVISQVQAGVRGITRPGYNTSLLKSIRVPVPPLNEQREIVRRVEALFALADKIEARVGAATARVERITQAVLAKAFRGELVPTEAELARQEGRGYEPASVLLDRIRAARAAPQRPRPARRSPPLGRK